MNVMLTCAGRRSYSVEVFKEAVGNRSRVFACDSNAEAPALQTTDKAFIVPRIDHEDYIDALLAICDDHKIGLLIPALEPEHLRVGSIVDCLASLVNGPALSQCRADQDIDEFGRGQVGFDRARKVHGLASKQKALSFVDVFRMVRNG